jgi:hypothetical protein
LKKSIIISLVLVLLTSFLTTGCDSNIQILHVGSNFGNKISSSHIYFTGTQTKSINAEKGKTIVLDYSSEVKKGTLSLKIFDPDKKEVLELETNEAGTKELKVEKDGKYKLIIKGSKTDGNYKVKWVVK